MPILPQNQGLKSGPLLGAGRAPGQYLRRYLAGLLAQDCILCAASGVDDIVCDACAADLPQMPTLCCPHCALPSPSGETCGHCLAKPPHFDSALAAYRYDFPLDKLIQSFKYGHRLTLAPYLGRQLVALAGTLAADLIVPLPLHSARLRQRGFNQALELARPISRAWRLPLDAASCQRTRNTPPQADLVLRERIKNMRNAFHCTKDFTGQRIILVDDVMTTGASLDECARTLKLHGASQVAVLVLARALPKPL